MSIQRLKVYAQQINLDLFHAAIKLALTTTESAKLIPSVQQQLYHIPWYEGSNSIHYLDDSGIRYLGELLERYGEHFGDNLRNLRAMAAAVAWVDPIFTASMSVGSQLSDFMEKLQENSSDPYIAASLCLLACDEQRDSLLYDLMCRSYTNLEELLYALAVLKDYPDAFNHLRPQLLSLLGTERTLPVEGNIGLFSWIIRHHRDDILSCRKKDNALLRALIRLNDGYVREDNPAYRTLVDAGYDRGEILAVNSMLVWEHHSGMPGLKADSIPAEKLATAYVLHCLNGEILPSEFGLAYIMELLALYNSFDIHYEGYPNLWEAVSAQLDIQSPAIMLWMIRDANLKYDYRIDVMNRKWDLLAQGLIAERYHELFRNQLHLMRGQSVEQIQGMLVRYHELTSHDYTDAFEKYNGLESYSFAILADCGLVDLWAHFLRHKEDLKEEHSSHTARHYIWEYAYNLATQAAFDFWKTFFSHHSPAEVPTFWSGHYFHEDFMRSPRDYYYSNSYSHISYLRPHLSSEDNRMLLEWIDQSVFVTAPSKFTQFVLSFLRSEDTPKLYERHELQTVYDALRSLDPKNASATDLRRRFLSEAELEQERIAAEMALIERQRRRWETELDEKRQLLNDSYDGSYHSVVTMFDKLSRWSDDKKQCAICIMERLPEFIASNPHVILSEYGHLLHLCSRLIHFEVMDEQAVHNVLQNISLVKPVKEALNNADAGTPECVVSNAAV